MSSLASLFQKISKPSPSEIDPEDSYHSIDAKVKQPKDGLEAETREIIQRTMGSSLLRNELELESSELQDPKYAARLVSVKDWTEVGDRQNPMGSDRSRDDSLSSKNLRRRRSQAELPNEDRERRSEEGDSGVEDEHEGSAGDEDLEEQRARFGQHPSSGSQSSTPESSSTSTSETRDRRKRSSDVPKPSVQPNPLQAQPQDHPSDLIQQLQVSVKADIAKGKAVKQQLATYDRILAIRIGLQKSLVATNKLTGLRLDGEVQPDGLEEKSRLAIENLLRISSKLGSLRAHLMESVDGQPPRKRRKDHVSDSEDGPSHQLAESVEDAEQLDKRLRPYLRTTIRKWSSKINSTISLNSKRFDPGSSKSQNVLDYLDQVWSSKLEREKLIERSRTIKPLPHHRSSTVIRDEDPHPCPRLFDDREFYLSLLKEVVETASRNQELTEDSMLQTRDYRSHRTHRENVDPKASKGRKIRYEVHDKLVSLMVPIQNELWTDAQKDELFGSLFGFGFEAEPAVQAAPSSERPSAEDRNDSVQPSLTQGFKLI